MKGLVTGGVEVFLCSTSEGSHVARYIRSARSSFAPYADLGRLGNEGMSTWKSCEVWEVSLAWPGDSRAGMASR